MSQTAVTVASPHAKESRIRSNSPMSQNGSTAAAKPPAGQNATARAGIKKISRLFAFTRLGRGRPESPHGHIQTEDPASTRESSPDVHQLTSRRRRGAGPEPRKPARNGLSRLVADQENQACAICATIDFPALLNWRPGQPRPWIPLAHTLAELSACPYCIFFQALVGAEPDTTRKFTPYLRIRQAFERLGVREKHELGGAVLFEVTTKSKVLPWGYIVRLVEGEDDMAGYKEATPMIRGRVIPPKLDTALPRIWIDHCMTNHKKTACASRGSPIRGLKLVDCRNNQVVFVDDLNAETIEYVTLSYVRGTPTDDEWDHKGLPEVLPPLLTDAIAVTKSLGFHYLWIDRFCFPQFSAAERRRQLEKMGEIYARSALTIIVAAGQGVQDGIPGISVSREEQLSLQTEAGCFTTSLTRPDVEVANSKWASRGWTYQEGLMARRRLVFTPSQIYFQCQTFHCHESISFPLKTNPTLNLGRVFANDAIGRSSTYKNIASGYFSRDFTIPEDRLDAFRGIADHYSQLDDPLDSVLGLPLYHTKDFKNLPNPNRTDRLAVGLGWYYDPPGDANISTHPMQRQGPFPSWTWLGWKLRPEYTGYGPNLNFYQLGEETPLIDNVSSVPNMTISLGYKDEKVLDWETQGEEIDARSTPISFLRLTTYCFEIHLTVPPPPPDTPTSTSFDTPRITLTSPDLLDDIHPSIAALLLRAAQPSPDSSESTSQPPPGEHQLIGCFISGRDWKIDESYESANVLICGRRNWDADDVLVRLGTLELGTGGLLGVDEDTAVVKGAMNNDRRLDVQLKELDIY
ncbi:heterokaryon incompatibility protein-domain-containing protein [Fusarium flagelliforme]|uniref:heterokaryon incompatibility protein-domain-containing protein n=1 Tax=Fusarium flagelliforme TaxID=2675880 RepID=UPI001E8E08A7|nr:heterokaryon incompatibility protein-domain-containing protein [Fusarium flagelliforme]KAH7188960.1 heterokaryon incompatibility protein-domain-containing protein [Fusarium flagelliforme]